jgi:hypothetical protein
MIVADDDAETGYTEIEDANGSPERLFRLFGARL